MGYGRPTKLHQATQAALRAVSGLDSDAHVGLITFESEFEVALDLQPLNEERVKAEFNLLNVKGVSCVAAGLTGAVGLFEKGGLGGEVLLLTDGRANLSLDRSGGFEGSLELERELLDISREISHKKITIHTISVGEDAFTHMLSMMAKNTGGFHWIVESFQGLHSKPKEPQLKTKTEYSRIHAAPTELPSAQPTWTKESQFTHLTVVSQSVCGAYESNHMTFLINPNNREARTALISVEDEILASYRARRPKIAEEIRNDTAILLDRSYRDYLDLDGNGSVALLIY